MFRSLTKTRPRLNTLLKGFLGVLLLGWVLVLPDALHAQGNDEDLLLGYIERNAELLEWARDVVMETESVPARRVLQESHRLHQRSVDMVQQGRPVMSLGVARRCRAGLWHAVGLAREALSYEERLRLRSDRFIDLHAHLKDLARESGDRRALDFVERAESQAIRAREQYRQGDAKLAFHLLEKAEKLLHRAARLLAESTGPERLESALERISAQIEITRELLGDNADPAALNLLAEAEEALDRARAHQDQGEPGRALQMSGLARKLVNRARNLGEGSPELGSVQAQLERLDDRLAAVSDRILDADSDAARRHLNKARQHRERASQALLEGKTELALRQIRAAADQLAQAEGLAR